MPASEKQQDHTDRFRNYLMAGMAGVVGGVVAAAVTIRREFAQDIGHIDAIKTNNGAMRQKITAITADFKNQPVETQRVGRSAFLKSISKIKGAGHAEERTILEGLGYRSQGLSGLTFGTWDRLKQMSRESSGAIFLNSTVSAAIVAGAAFTFFNNNHTRAKLDELSERRDAKDQQHGRG